MKNDYSGDLMFNGILPIELEAFTLELNGHEHDWCRDVWCGHLDSRFYTRRRCHLQLPGVHQPWVPGTPGVHLATCVCMPTPGYTPTPGVPGVGVLDSIPMPTPITWDLSPGTDSN